MSKLRGAIIIVLTLICLISGIISVSDILRKKQDEDFYESLRIPDETTTEQYAPLVEPKDEIVEDVVNEPVLVYEAPEKLQNLQSNDAVVGWIEIADTHVDYPIAQNKEDNEFFLDHDINGKKNTVGSIYLDANHNIDEEGLHVLYGHHMKNGSMFKDVSKFIDPSYMQEHSEIVIFTYQDEINLEPVYCYAGKADGDYRAQISSQSELSQFLEAKTGMQISGNNIFVLITCSYGSADERTYLICKERD